MRLAVTGGGTGGHVYPAIEVAKFCRDEGAELRYFGSLRGQESAICGREKIQFSGFDSRPLYSLRQPRGWRSLARLTLATGVAKKALRNWKPDALFSTGGYSAAPVMWAARSLRIPFVVHEANSVPGRSNRMFAQTSAGFTCVFEATKNVVPKAVRTGQPIRRELREAAQRTEALEGDSLVLGLGGSQGSEFLNKVFPSAAILSSANARWLLATGRKNFDRVNAETKGDGGNLSLTAYLETEQLVQSYLRTKVVVGRSGGSVAEFAMFGLPSVLIPLPTSADDHQMKNAEEFVKFGGATLLKQDSASPAHLRDAVEAWIGDASRWKTASLALKAWDLPNATRSIASIVFEIGGRR